MNTFNVTRHDQRDQISRKASRRGMSISPVYGQYAITFSPERIEHLRRTTGKLKPGVIALCGNLDEVDDFLQGVDRIAE